CKYKFIQGLLIVWDIFGGGSNIYRLYKWVRAIIQTWIITRTVRKFSSQYRSNMLQSIHFPMLWNLPQPLHPRILHTHRRIKPFSNSMANKSSTLLLQKFDQSLLLRYQSVNA